jgi:hypothetical protein
MPLGLFAQEQTGSFNEQYMTQAKANAAAQAKVSAALLRKKYSGDDAMEKSLYQVIYQGKLETELTSLKYANSPDLESRLANVIAKTDSITQTYLPATKSKSLAINSAEQLGSNSKFTAAVRLKNELSLTQVQVDSLMYHANRLKELQQSNPDYYPKDYEREVLPRVLSDGQYTSLLVNLNKSAALRNAKSDWKELKQRALLPGADSTKVISDITTYNIYRSAIKDRYNGATAQLSESMQALVTPEPQATTLLKRARRYSNPLPDTQKPTFTW